ncbi:hypothetical protein FPV67DRAFT_920339 [Lyophyllum atratum]|nr:hypothetical protein FPV67DRAFT_920339 [Lyophyllum atratum]
MYEVFSFDLVRAILDGRMGASEHARLRSLATRVSHYVPRSDRTDPAQEGLCTTLTPPCALFGASSSYLGLLSNFVTLFQIPVRSYISFLALPPTLLPLSTCLLVASWYKTKRYRTKAISIVCPDPRRDAREPTSIYFLSGVAPLLVFSTWPPYSSQVARSGIFNQGTASLLSFIFSSPNP